jgi:hypothetical protein
MHSSSYDEDSRTAINYATSHATHTGEGGPVPPTGKTTNSHYVYALTMDKNDKIGKMTKIWNASWALRELGWS